MKEGFLDKLIARLDLLDPQSLQTHFLRLAQERGLLETIFQSIQEGILVMDGSGLLTYANRAAEHLLGFSLETARGRPVSRFLRDIDWDRLLGLDAGEWSKLISSELETTYPEHRFLNFYIAPLPATDNQDSGLVMILRDVTGERREEASLLESERINAIKLLAAGVAHEIGNPLNALNIHLQLLDREIADLPESARDNLAELTRVARNEVARLDLIITQFLRAIRPSKPNLVATAVGELLEDTLTLMRQEIENRAIEVKLDIPGTLPPVHLDPNQIKQAFFNVIKNAFQAMPDGGALHITLSVEGRFLSVAFTDTGVGIEPGNFARLFDPYFTTKPGGSGLGMMIVQRIVQDHGGQIEVESKPGAGTVLTILLPLAQPRVRLLPKAEEHPPKKLPEPGHDHTE